MSELKATTAQEIVQNEKDCDYMDELFGGVKMPPTQVYLKSEADKVIAEKDKEIARLEAIRKVHVEAIASMEAGLHQDEKEIRRLKRALYKALANWAHEAKFDYDDDFGPWYDMEHKCLKKAEEYK